MRVWGVSVNLIVLIAHRHCPKGTSRNKRGQLDRNKKFKKYKNFVFSSNGIIHKSP